MEDPTDKSSEEAEILPEPKTTKPLMVNIKFKINFNFFKLKNFKIRKRKNLKRKKLKKLNRQLLSILERYNLVNDFCFSILIRVNITKITGIKNNSNSI